ncbi:MAG: RDD family protein [Planctomycetes bacterium]|nr:RDD family protein [Planctomycetota bacterium]
MQQLFRIVAGSMQIALRRLVMVAALGFGAQANAVLPDFLPGAGAPMREGESYPAATYSWFVFPAAGGSGYVLAHLPPRIRESESGPAVEDGVFRSALRVEQPPEAMAAWGNALYVAFAARQGDETHSVYSIRAKRFADSTLWTDEPSGRLEALPGLPGNERLVGFTAVEAGPCALLNAAGALRLLQLNQKWSLIEMPPELAKAENSEVWLSGDSEGIWILQQAPGGFQSWNAKLSPSSSSSPTSGWKWTRAGFFAGGKSLPGADAVRVGGRWYVLNSVRRETLTVDRLDSGAPVRVAEVSCPGSGRSVAPIDGLNRLVFISVVAKEGSEGKSLADQTVKVREISLQSGKALYDGPAKSNNPLGSSQFRLMAVGLIFSMALILVLVIRSDESPEPRLPDGYSLAEPVRRMVAGILDFAIVALLVPRLSGNSVLELLGPSVWLSGEAYQTLILIAVFGTIAGTVGEHYFGRSPGKLLADCEVVALRRGDDGSAYRPTLAASFVRNLVKWFLSPVAVLGLIDSTARHRGDQIAKTAVVVPIVPHDESDDPFAGE